MSNLFFFFHLRTSMSSRVTHDPDANIYAEFDEEFDEIESPIGQCTALYSFEGEFYD